jgi:hypothetical protein
MATLDIVKLHIDPFWDREYRFLYYIHESFNDVDSLNRWRNLGYSGLFTGAMCDMRSRQPSWNSKFIEYFSKLGWNNIGTSYYRMDTGTVLPTHSDLYTKYIDLFDLHNKKTSIFRAIVFLEDWQSGHYAEYNNQPYVNWKAGDCVYWQYDLPHMAANIGIAPRYTLQITGHI